MYMQFKVEGTLLAVNYYRGKADRMVSPGIMPTSLLHQYMLTYWQGWGTEVLLMSTSDCLPLSHPTKMKEPQTVVLPLLGLISVV